MISVLGFSDYGGLSGDPGAGGEAHVAWDDNNLYLGIISPAEKKLQTSQSGVDSEVWLDDAVEIFLSEFLINVKKVVKSSGGKLSTQ